MTSKGFVVRVAICTGPDEPTVQRFTTLSVAFRRYRWGCQCVLDRLALWASIDAEISDPDGVLLGIVTLESFGEG